MDEALIDFLQDLMEMRDAQIERLAPQITAAAQLAASCLTNDGKIFVFGAEDSSHIAQLFERQLINKYQIERPNLPCIALPTAGHFADSDPSAQRLRALAKPEDCFMIFSSVGENQTTESLLSIAMERGMSVVLIGSASQNGLAELSQNNGLAISIEVAHKAHLLDSQLSIALAIAGLIDFQLFGSAL